MIHQPVAPLELTAEPEAAIHQSEPPDVGSSHHCAARGDAAGGAGGARAPGELHGAGTQQMSRYEPSLLTNSALISHQMNKNI